MCPFLSYWGPGHTGWVKEGPLSWSCEQSSVAGSFLGRFLEPTLGSPARGRSLCSVPWALTMEGQHEKGPLGLCPKADRASPPHREEKAQRRAPHMGGPPGSQGCTPWGPGRRTLFTLIQDTAPQRAPVCWAPHSAVGTSMEGQALSHTAV